MESYIFPPSSCSPFFVEKTHLGLLLRRKEKQERENGSRERVELEGGGSWKRWREIYLLYRWEVTVINGCNFC